MHLISSWKLQALSSGISRAQFALELIHCKSRTNQFKLFDSSYQFESNSNFSHSAFLFQKSEFRTGTDWNRLETTTLKREAFSMQWPCFDPSPWNHLTQNYWDTRRRNPSLTRRNGRLLSVTILTLTRSNEATQTVRSKAVYLVCKSCYNVWNLPD